MPEYKQKKKKEGSSKKEDGGISQHITMKPFETLSRGRSEDDIALKGEVKKTEIVNIAVKLSET